MNAYFDCYDHEDNCDCCECVAVKTAIKKLRKAQKLPTHSLKRHTNKKGFTLIEVFTLIFIIFALIGEVQCIIKCVSSDWKPSYKREIIYGISTITGLGSIVGWINIPDVVEK